MIWGGGDEDINDIGGGEKILVTWVWQVVVCN